MNVSISRIAVFAVAMIAALIVATTYWQTWATASLNDRQENAIQKVAEFSIERGRILASDGRTVLARNEEHVDEQDRRDPDEAELVRKRGVDEVRVQEGDQLAAARRRERPLAEAGAAEAAERDREE